MMPRRFELTNGRKRAVFVDDGRGWCPNWFYETDRPMLRLKDHEWLSLGHVKLKHAREATPQDGGRYVFSGRSAYGKTLVNWMASFGFDQVHLVSQGLGTIPGALAALLDDRVRQVTLIHAPVSSSTLAEAPMQHRPFSAMLPEVLERFDLPDVYRDLAAEKDLYLVDLWTTAITSGGAAPRFAVKRNE